MNTTHLYCGWDLSSTCIITIACNFVLCARFYGLMHMYYLSTYLSRTCIKINVSDLVRHTYMEGGANEYAWVYICVLCAL